MAKAFESLGLDSPLPSVPSLNMRSLRRTSLRLQRSRSVPQPSGKVKVLRPSAATQCPDCQVGRRHTSPHPHVAGSPADQWNPLHQSRANGHRLWNRLFGVLLSVTRTLVTSRLAQRTRVQQEAISPLTTKSAIATSMISRLIDLTTIMSLAQI